MDIFAVSNARQAASDAQKAASDAEKAAADGKNAASDAQKAASAEHVTAAATLDPNLPVFIAALKNASIPPAQEPKLVIVPLYPNSSGASASQVSSATGTGERKLPVLPNFEIIPCSADFKTASAPPAAIASPAAPAATGNQASTTPTANQETPDDCDQTAKPAQNWSSLKFPGPIELSVIYRNKEDKQNLELLDFRGFLSTGAANPGAQGALGICPYPQIGPTIPWSAKANIPRNLAVEFGPFWTSGDRRKAQQAWEKAELYLTLCTTFRSYDSGVILNRAVYEIAAPKENTRTLTIPPDDFENVVLP
jgi:hypothetical protein